jgi:hypothetical protein
MPEAIADLQSKEESKNFEVWEENWEVVIMILRMSTQWNTGMSGATGLHYPSLEWLCKLYSVKDPVAVFEGVQIMEMAALAAMHEKQ